VKSCCPPGRGCNSPAKDEPCLLELCREALAGEPKAALAVARWDEWERASSRASSGRGERRFRRRAYERARDDALAPLLIRAQAAARAARRDARASRSRSRSARGRPATRVGVPLGDRRAAS
jgi:hypothetical protein